jgi:hypothetical protein
LGVKKPPIGGLGEDVPTLDNAVLGSVVWVSADELRVYFRKYELAIQRQDIPYLILMLDMAMKGEAAQSPEIISLDPSS